MPRKVRRPQIAAPVVAQAGSTRRREWRDGAVVFLAALALRALFWQATPDALWPHSAAFKGDALLWLDYAQALHSGRAFELGLPIHPPGTAFLVAALWNGTPAGIATLKLAWILFGALTAALVFLAARRAFGASVAALAAAWVTASTGLLILSTSLDSEAPYLLLVAGSFALLATPEPAAWRAALWSALQGAACLFRPEHALFYVLALATGSAFPEGDDAAAPVDPSPAVRRLRLAGVSLLAFTLPLVPWHARAWAAIRAFNEQLPAATAQDVEALRRVAGGIDEAGWDDGAKLERDRIPAFSRRTAAAFVAATVAHRGGHAVRVEDFACLDDAFGYRPRPLARLPFVSLYGPLNFALANNPTATGGFDTALLEQPPPLAGGAARFPPELVAGLPPPQLALTYPPHLRLFNDGYAVGWAWIRENPAGALSLAGRKLALFWSGAALGLGGFDLPLGLSGTRRAVDLVAPDGSWPLAWQALVLALCAGGLVRGWRRAPLRPWLLFLLSRTVVAVLFFGYARHGALVTPVVAILGALALERTLSPARFERAAGAGLGVGLALLVALEAARFAAAPRLLLDGRGIAGGDPVPADHHRDVRLEVRLR